MAHAKLRVVHPCTPNTQITHMYRSKPLCLTLYLRYLLTHRMCNLSGPYIGTQTKSLKSKQKPELSQIHSHLNHLYLLNVGNEKFHEHNRKQDGFHLR